MLDDLANEWGKQYCLLETKRIPDTCQVEMRQDYTMFNQIIMRLCENKFCLAKCCSSGTDANMWSIFEATGSVRSTCGIAAGSYLAGEGSMQCWSTSCFCIKKDICKIQKPTDATDIAQSITLPLPYHIPQCKNEKNTESILEAFEQQCLEEIHLRCLMFKLEGRPMRALVMELILASNGGELSDRFLKNIGTLAKHHEFSIIVDEILTGARVGPKLLRTLSTPKEFQTAVGFVTLGKWPGLGISLKNMDTVCGEEPRGPTRGPSTFLRIDKAMECLKYVDQHLSTISKRRETVLKKLKVKEEDTWGKGLLIFVPKRRSDSSKGLKNRYLPMLSNSPIITIPMSRLSAPKDLVDLQIRDDVRLWIRHSRNVGPIPNRTIVEKLFEITKQQRPLGEAHYFVGKHDIQSYMKETLFKKVIGNTSKPKLEVLVSDKSHKSTTDSSGNELEENTNCISSESSEDSVLLQSRYNRRGIAVPSSLRKTKGNSVCTEERPFHVIESTSNNQKRQRLSKSIMDNHDIQQTVSKSKTEMKTELKVGNIDSKAKIPFSYAKLLDLKSEANCAVALAESIGLLDYKYIKGKKRLRRLTIRNDCGIPLWHQDGEF